MDIYRKELKCLYVFASGLSTLKKCKGISLEGFVKAMKTNLPNADFSFPCILDDRMLKYGQAGEKIKKFEKSYEIIPSENIRKKLGNSGMMWLASNAQNLNCRSIAKNINKKQFRIKALISYSGDLNIPIIDEVEYISAFYPHRISKYIAYLKGIFWCDIAIPDG